MKQYIKNFKMYDGEMSYECQVPCSVYKTLIENNVIKDPYYGENELVSTPICDRDFTVESIFTLDDRTLSSDRIMLVFEGLDTLTDIYLNGIKLASTDNMHRRYEFEIKNLAEPENILKIDFKSPNKFVTEKANERPLYGVEHSMPGYQYLRKAHCMFGWDWGPKLPDMGIWRSVYVEGINTGRIENVYYTQKHEEGKVTLSCDAALDIWDNNCDNSIKARLIVTSPNGKGFETELKNGGGEIVIENPKLWWVRGLGEQPLYTCRVILKKNDTILDENIKKIGLRTLSVSQDKDEWGEEFCFINNGVKIFAMGGNYIPEDQIVTRCGKERTEKLLDSCLEANYNFIRVWGGGYYPDDYFFDYCDEKGLIVWQDFMFACAAYLLSPEFEATVREEIKDNIIRIRNHASLGLWCGNNEIESAWEYWGWNDDPEAKADYLKLFENIIPSLLKEYDPETFYWPSSPSSGGGFRDSSSNHAGDMHYWAIWHSFAPIDAFRKLYYRFCSEYGFESVPDIKTIKSFAKEDELDLCGNVMQAHQKCTLGNEKLMYYLAQMVNYPYDFERLIYCSQLVQADCIRSSVEHMRRARGRCMGSAYWQVNDSNPVISWSSIDYFGRWKALHYYAKRFYAPLLISCDDTDPAKPVLYVTNDTLNDENLKIVCKLRNNRAEIIREFSTECTSPALSSIKVLETDLSKDMVTLNDKRTKYLEYTLYKNNEIVLKGTTLFVRPKEFCFLPAKIEYIVTEKDNSFELTLSSDVYAKSVCLSLSEHEVKFSDNWFDIHGDESVKVNIPKEYGADGSLLITEEILKKELQIRNY